MTTKVIFLILVLVNGSWTPETEDGWAPMVQPDWATCMERRVFFDDHRPKGSKRKGMCLRTHTRRQQYD